MSRAVKYVFMSSTIAVLVVIALLLYGVLAGPSPDEATAGSSAGPAAIVPVATTAPAATAVPAGDFSPAEIYRKSAAGVVMVRAVFGGSADPHGGSGEALGSGFVVDEEGTILTNAHVVTEDDGAEAQSVSVAFREGDDETSGQIDAAVVGVDQTTDVAVLRIEPGERDLTPLPLGDSSRVGIGQWVVAIGNPLGFDFSLTAGIVSGLGRDLRAPNGAVIPNGIQTDAAINQGNSGGPLLDQDGNVIGINEQIATTSGSFSGLGFAIPINLAKQVMRQIAETGEVRHAFLGVEGLTITRPLAEVLGLPVEEGVLVIAVQPGTAADEAGITGGTDTRTIQGMPVRVGGDVITRLDGRPLAGMEDLAGTIAEKQPGDQVTLTVVGDGETREVTVELGDRP
jgi:S1-C subfamily serine protease